MLKNRAWLLLKIRLFLVEVPYMHLKRWEQRNIMQSKIHTYFDNPLSSYLHSTELDAFLRIYFNYSNKIKGKKIFKIFKILKKIFQVPCFCLTCNFNFNTIFIHYILFIVSVSLNESNMSCIFFLFRFIIMQQKVVLHVW